MFVIQCIIISLLCAVSGNAFPLLGNLKRPLSGNSLGWYTLGRPLIGGTICGIILGDIKAGVELGIGVQLVYRYLRKVGCRRNNCHCIWNRCIGVIYLYCTSCGGKYD